MLKRGRLLALLLSFALLAAMLPAVSAQWGMNLPDLGGRTIVAVTENAYTPLNFEDPATGQAMGWEYDAMAELCQRLNCTVEWNLIGWDAMIPAVADGQYDIGMDGITITDERAQQVAFSAPVHDPGAVHARPRGRGPLRQRRRLRRQPRPAVRLPAGHHALLHRRLQRPGWR